jgi:EAL domain-containing protein (putative c-di-GMP-specific phosphodiesterase class I)
VLREACLRASSWRHAGYALEITVNVSPRQLEADSLIDDVRRALGDSGLDAGALTLEVTETALMRDAQETARRLAALRTLGVRVAIDDFGTGYSSLAHLRELPADALKIDRSFVRDIVTSARARSLVRTLIHLGHGLDIETIAEGIEDRAQLELLRREGCDQAQGYLFARPLEADAMDAFLSVTATAHVRGAS